MNTRLIACSVVAVFSLVGPTVDAQTAQVAERPVSFGFVLGSDAFAGGFRGGAAQGSIGEAVGVQALVPLASRHLAVRGDLLYFAAAPAAGCPLSAPDAGNPNRFNCSGPRVPTEEYAWSADIVARLNDRSVRWSPYVLVGGALYWCPSPAPLHLAHNGLQAGVGFEVRTAKYTNMFAELRYMNFGAGGLAPITLGMRF
jgi:hypothetical protein